MILRERGSSNPAGRNPTSASWRLGCWLWRDSGAEDSSGNGTRVLRRYVGHGAYETEALAEADDFADSDARSSVGPRDRVYAGSSFWMLY